MPPDAGKPSGGNEAYLRDMVDACERVARFVKSKSLSDYQDDELLRAGVERQIEIIGEAARRLSEDYRSAHPEIPWRAIIAQRHILAHEYGDVEASLIWRVATVHVPALLGGLRPLLPPDDAL